MLVLMLATQIRAALRLTDDKQDSHQCPEAGHLISTLFADGRICVLLPPGYTSQEVNEAASLLRQEKVQVRVHRMSLFERIRTRRFSGTHADTVHKDVHHHWMVFAIPPRVIHVGMPRGPAARWRARHP